MEPFSPRFLAQLEQIQKEAERQSRLVQQVIPPETIRMLNQVAKDVTKATAPIRAVVQSPGFQQHLKSMQELSLKLSQIYARPTITVTDFETFNTLDEVATEVAVEVTEKPEDVPLAAREIVSATKIEAKKGRLITPLSLPSSIYWEDIRVTFVDSQTVLIEFPTISKKITVGYMDMGMWDGRNMKPNAQWMIWRTLAKTGGRIEWGGRYVSPQVKKQKQLLSAALSSYFNIEGDPFQVYRQVKSYEIKMTLIDTFSIPPINEDKEEYDNMTPSVFEENQFGYH